LRQEASQKGLPGASMAIAVDGAPAHTSIYGVRRRGALGEVDTDTIFRINSTTKMMGAAAVMQLVEQERLDLHAPITDYVPELRFAAPWSASDLTLHTLLANAGGLPDPYLDFSRMPEVYDIPAWDIDLRGWARRLGTMHLYAPPGSFWNYSSPNFSIAGLALERVTGMRWEDYVVERLLRPAGMPLATYDPEAVVASGNYVSGHYQSRVYEPADYQRPYAAPGGGTFSTPTELITWALMLMDGGGEILSPASVEAMTTRHYKAEAVPWAQRSDYGYGYGIFIEDFRSIDDSSRRVEVLHHPGNGRGQGTELYWVPELGFAIATLINQHGTMRNTVDCALRTLARIERAPPPAGGRPRAQWDHYAGSYAVQNVFGHRWTARVERIGNTLRLHHPDWHLVPAIQEIYPEPVPLNHRFLDTFGYAYAGDQTITFEPGGARPEHAGWLRNQYFVGQRIGELPERLEIEGDGCATLDLVSAHDTDLPRVGAYGLVEPRRWTDESIAQEDPNDPSSSRFKVDLNVEGDLGYLSAWLFKEDDDQLGMHLMQDQDGDGVFAWPEELVEQLTSATGQAVLVAERSVPGPYQLWVHGRQVSGAASRFALDVVAISGQALRVEGPPDRLRAGEAARFEVCAEPPREADTERVGIVEIDYGAPGALGRVPVYWKPGEAPAPEPSVPTILLPWLAREGS
jgi:CubicO group peptidase (beta-lactamase class C family)